MTFFLYCSCLAYAIFHSTICCLIFFSFVFSLRRPPDDYVHTPQLRLVDEYCYPCNYCFRFFLSCFLCKTDIDELDCWKLDHVQAGRADQNNQYPCSSHFSTFHSFVEAWRRSSTCFITSCFILFYYYYYYYFDHSTLLDLDLLRRTCSVRISFPPVVPATSQQQH